MNIKIVPKTKRRSKFLFIFSNFEISKLANIEFGSKDVKYKSNERYIPTKTDAIVENVSIFFIKEVTITKIMSFTFVKIKQLKKGSIKMITGNIIMLHAVIS